MEECEIGKLVNVLSRQIKRKIDCEAEKYEVTGVQSLILHYIFKKSKERNVFQKDIEIEFDLRRASATGILQLMEKKGLIQREAMDHDARLKRIMLRDKSLLIQNSINREIEMLEQNLIKNITEQERVIFCKVIHQMSMNME